MISTTEHIKPCMLRLISIHCYVARLQRGYIPVSRHHGIR